jgi:hypothetical protein
MSCPRCSSMSVTRDGTTQLGGQRFRCGQCGRRFTRRSSSAFSGRGFPDDVIGYSCIRVGCSVLGCNLTAGTGSNAPDLNSAGRIRRGAGTGSHWPP